MNKRIFLAFILVLLVGLGLWALLRKKPESPTPAMSVEAQNQPTEQQQAKPGSPRTSTPVTTAPVRSRSSTTGGTVVEGVPVSADVLRYVQNVQADPQYDWKQPINFYGSVLDENNQPVSGATASFEWTDLSQKGTSKATAISDANGFFSVTDQQGKRLFVDVAKDGYYSSGNARGAAFEYANPGDGLFTPDAANPVVFHLRKKGEAAQLIHGLKLFGTRIDGSLSYVDLTTAKNGRTPPGDLTVQCTRSERNADKKFDWTFTLGVPGGGVIQSTDEFMFLAPDGGYQPTFQISHRINDPDWTGQEKRKFFIKSRNGQHYARIEITIMPDYNQNAAYDVEWFLNPNGSPNLESAPDKTTNVQ